jgi:hypothetical protein
MGTACFTACVLACMNCCMSEIGAAFSGLFEKSRLTKFSYIILDLMVVIPAIFIIYSMENWLSFAIQFGRWIRCP